MELARVRIAGICTGRRFDYAVNEKAHPWAMLFQVFPFLRHIVLVEWLGKALSGQAVELAELNLSEYLRYYLRAGFRRLYALRCFRFCRFPWHSL